jgi:hypothetical protein
MRSHARDAKWCACCQVQFCEEWKRYLMVLASIQSVEETQSDERVPLKMCASAPRTRPVQVVALNAEFGTFQTADSMRNDGTSSMRPSSTILFSRRLRMRTTRL